ncbi:MAG TPA: hypothetical protein VJK30_00785 [Coxiellaceae bacterium]|nr:MAG: hypothetical protein A3E81_05155 [Gammaproteobacteria bacterium RIFCSPHIGHO2_12_FULL_36_30]HLB55853.1 hypothetical protein [Coxiellaceae bacterium]
MAAEGWSPPTCNYSCPVAGPAINSCQCLSAHSEKDYNKYLSDHSYQCNGSFGGSPINNNGISFFVTHEKEWHLIPLTVQKEKEIFYYQKGTCRYVSYCLNQEGKYVKKRPLIIHVIWDEDCNIAPASVLQNLGNSSGNSGNFGNLVNENGKLLMSNP